MSTGGEPQLTAWERAALERLDATVSSDNPRLHRRLSTFRRARISAAVDERRRCIRSGWWGGPAVLAGLALMLLSLSTSVMLDSSGPP